MIPSSTDSSVPHQILAPSTIYMHYIVQKSTSTIFTYTLSTTPQAKSIYSIDIQCPLPSTVFAYLTKVHPNIISVTST